jgi:hypothetical protein
VKPRLVAGLLLLGAFNLLFSGPRLARATRHALQLDADDAAQGQIARLFRLAVHGEALLACGVLVAVGVMTSSQPAKDAWADLTLRLRVDPGEPGFNDVRLAVRDARTGKPVADAEKEALIVTRQEHDMGENELVLEHRGDGVYTVRQGRDDMRAAFTIALGNQPTSNGPARVAMAGAATRGDTRCPSRCPALGRSTRRSRGAIHRRARLFRLPRHCTAARRCDRRAGRRAWLRPTRRSGWWRRC